MDIAEVRLDVYDVNRRMGLWCDPCALPSALEVDLVVAHESDPSHVVARYRLHWCPDCGAESSDPPIPRGQDV